MSNQDKRVTVSAGAVEAYLTRIERLAETFSGLSGQDEFTEAEAKDVARNSEAFAEAVKELALRMEAHQERAAAANRQAETLRRNANGLFA